MRLVHGKATAAADDDATDDPRDPELYRRGIAEARAALQEAMARRSEARQSDRLNRGALNRGDLNRDGVRGEPIGDDW